MKLKSSIVASLAFIPALLCTSLLQAAPVTGVANIGGNVTVVDGVIGFAPVFTSTVNATETGAFAGLTGGTIQTLTGGPITGNLPTPVVNFVNFNTGVAAPVSFDLSFLAPGVGNASSCTTGGIGSSCTPTGSPFTLFQLTSNTILVSLQMNGVAYTGTSATGSTPTTAIFSTQTFGTIPDLYATLVAGGAITGVTYSASFISNASPNVPEPLSMGLVAIGMIAAGLIARNRKISARD